ncbi:MAG: haloacid dehalogenase type II [Dehalococcoidia bacterium]
MADLDRIKALAFDVGGTVFDWHSTIRDEISRLAADRGVEVDAPQFTNQWRFGMFQHLGRVRSGELPWMNADALHRLALDDVAKDHPALELSAADRDELNTVWHRLNIWPDFPQALEALRSRYTVVVLTVLSWSIVVDSSKRHGLSWDGILSCEFLGHYKPDREAYLAGARTLGVAPEQVMMVAAHPGDLRAAMAAGFSSAYVPRPGERGEGNDGDLSPQDDIAVNATDFPDLARKLVG